MSECRYGSGSVIEEADLKRLLAEDCVIEPGAVIHLYYGEEVTAEQLGSGVVTTAPAKRRTMEDQEASGIVAAQVPQPPAAPVALTAPTPAPVAASTEVAAPVDVTALTQMTGGNGGVAVVLTLLAVLFGAAGWKFWSKVSEQHHEHKMKQLELDAAAASRQSDKSPQQCATVHAQHEARLAALEGKVAAVQEAASGFDLDFDPADLKKRLTKIEKALKAKKPSA